MDIESGVRARQIDNRKLILYRNIIYTVLVALQILSIIVTLFTVLSLSGIITPNITALCATEYKTLKLLQLTSINYTRNGRNT